MRWTLDLDNTDEERLSETLARIQKHFGNGQRVRYRVSGSGNGFHVEWHHDSEVSFEEKIIVRAWLGDDPLRCDIDWKNHLRGLETDFLYDGYWKNQEYFEAGRWKEVKL